MRNSFVAGLVALAIIAVVRPAEAPPATDLLHPTSVHLVRGTSSTSDAAAVSAMQTDVDSDHYDVTSTKRKGVDAVSYTFGVSGAAKPSVLSLDWNGETTVPCTLHLALYSWKAHKWVGAAFDADTTADQLHTLHTTRPARFVKGGHIRGKVSCNETGSTFTFSTERIRLPLTHAS